jgi:hypothetical protein
LQPKIVHVVMAVAASGIAEEVVEEAAEVTTGVKRLV